jgi:hypothetical protein
MSVALRRGRIYNRNMPDSLASSESTQKDAYIGELRQTLGDLERLLGEEGSVDEPPVSARAALAAQARPEPERAPLAPAGPARQAPTQQSGPKPVAARPAAPQLPPPSPVEDSRDLQLLTRFVAGALILGAEELVARARRWEQQAPAGAEPAPGGAPLDEASYLELARYWTLGAVAYGRRTGVSALRAALRGPDGMVPSLLNLTDRATSIIFLRPLRGPMSRAIRHAQNTSRDWIVEGWREEQLSRWIAENGVPEILDDVIAIISRNPELAELVRNQLTQQSASVASSVIESSRKLSAVGDDIAEGFARRLLRRGRRTEIQRIVPKSELPPEMALRLPPNANGETDP